MPIKDKKEGKDYIQRTRSEKNCPIVEPKSPKFVDLARATKKYSIVLVIVEQCKNVDFLGSPYIHARLSARLISISYFYG